MTVSIPLIFATICITVTLHVIIQFLIRWYRLRNIPGPGGLPVVGTMYIKEFRNKTAKFLRRMHDNYGGLFLVWGVFNNPIITITDPKLAREVLINERVFRKGPGYEEVFAQAFGKGLVTSAGQKHKKDRSLLNKYFIRKNIAASIPMFAEEAQLSLGEIMKHGDGAVLDVSKFFLHLTMRLFTRYSLDFNLRTELPGGTDSKLLKQAVKRCGDMSIAVGASVYFMLPTSRLLNPLMWTVDKSNVSFDALSDIVLENREKKRKEGVEKDDTLKAMLDANMTTKDIKEHLRTMFGAGHDTTGYFETYTAKLLSEHPEVQQRVKEEIKQVMNGREMVTDEDLGNMKYLFCVLKESLRMYSIIPGIQRMTSQDTVLGKHRIPANTQLMIAMAIMNKNEDVWENPMEFKPDRFKDIVYEQCTKRGYYPFAYGARNCIGSTLALMEAAVAFAYILPKVTFEPVKEFKPKFSKFCISLVATKGMQLRIRHDN